MSDRIVSHIQPMRWGEKRYHSLDFHLRSQFGEKVYRIALNGGMTCPNRDGSIGTGGCIFCSAEGSGDFAGRPSLTIRQQLDAGRRQLLSKRPRHFLYCLFSGFYKHICAGRIPGIYIYGSDRRPRCESAFHCHPGLTVWVTM